MKNIMVTYKVKSTKIEEVKNAIVNFIDAIIEREQDTIRYEAYQEPDGVSFVHLMAFRDEAAEQLHRNSTYTAKFTSILYLNCEKEPVFTELKEVSSK